MKSPSVSVVVPVYKTAPYVRQCLDSILNGKLKDIEVIAVDDGSPDEAGAILDEYAKKDPRVRVIHQKNQGAGHAYNVGMWAAKGTYVGFIDSDDWIEPDMYYDLFQAALKTSADIVKSAGYITELPKGSAIDMLIPPHKCNRLITNLMEVPEMVKRHCCLWSAIYKRSFITKNDLKYPDDIRELASDISFGYQVWITAKSFYCLNRPYVHYRQTNPNSDTKQGTRMSFYLLEGHKRGRDFMKKCPHTTKAHWAHKARGEFEHFRFEWNSRCKKRRREFAFKMSRMFRESLCGKVADKHLFNEKEWTWYQFVAYMPILFYLNDILKFNAHYSRADKTQESYFLFGLFKTVQTPHFKRKTFLGLPYWRERLYDGELADLRNMCLKMTNELQMINQKMKGKK